MLPFKSGRGELPRLGGLERSAHLGQARSWQRPEKTPQRQSQYQSAVKTIDGFLDITEHKVPENHLEKLADQESLTGLPNRALFHDHLRLVLSQASRYGYLAAMIMLGIDPCKTINDIPGHLRGDLLLKSIGQRLTSELRKADAVARLGENEFGIIAARISRVGDETKIAQRILNLFQQPFIFEENEVWITASIGVALYPKDAEDPQTLVKKADMAMYGAQVAGWNNFQHYSAALNLWRNKKPGQNKRVGQAV